ncbi:MAG TPA: serine/threonine-protein kinase [Actinoplanes sp.]|nr:serine/threonine-protein kinase [Actinoplanes sp.]
MPLRAGDPAGLGRYELVGRLGEGGMGTVYLGRGPDGRLVAIKMVRSEFAHESEFRGRFRSEVNRAKQVPPFSTAEVLDADPDHEPPYLVVEYVDGPSLAAEVRTNGPLSGASLHQVAVGIATALTAIHGAGVIHRDLKPGNVLFARGGIKVIDFGIARAFEATSQHTRTDQVVGTVAYMAPERYDPVGGRPVTAAADIFAWGAVVAFAATGRTPFAADSAAATAMRILTREPDLAGVPDSLAEAVAWALTKEPQNRPTARELLDLLLAGDTQRPAVVTVATAGPAGRVVRAKPRFGSTAVVLTTVAAVLAAATTGVAVRYLPRASGQVATPPPSVAPTAGPPLTVEEKTLAILHGSRKTLIHVAEIDRDLAMESDYDELKVGDGTGAKSEFALIPVGIDFMISYLSDPGTPEPCLGIQYSPTAAATVVTAECDPGEGTLFRTSKTGQYDDQGRPTYTISSKTFGILQFSEDTRTFFVEVAPDGPPLSSFSFVDRGPLPSPAPS